MTIKERLDAISDRLSEISIRGSFQSCSAADRVFHRFIRFSADAKKQIARGRVIEGFAIALKCFVKGKAMCSKADTSSGAWQFNEMESIEAMEAAVDAVLVENEKDYMFTELLKEAVKKDVFEWDGDFDLLRIATRLVTEKNSKKWLDKLSEIAEAHNKRPYSGWRKGNEIILMSEYMLNFEPDSYKAYLDEHLAEEEIRKKRAELAIKEGQYALAEKFCVRECKKENYLSHNFWAELLVEIYKKTNQTEKLLAFFEELLFKFTSSQKFDAYKEMREIYLSLGKWDAEYKRILERAFNKNERLYIQILEREEDWERYIDALQSSPRDIYESGEKFVKEYPKQVYDLYRLAILKDAEKANIRTHYYWLGKHLKDLVKLGGEDEADAIREELKCLYSHRPAMIDELETARLGRRSTAWDNRRRW